MALQAAVYDTVLARLMGLYSHTPHRPPWPLFVHPQHPHQPWPRNFPLGTRIKGTATPLHLLRANYMLHLPNQDLGPSIWDCTGIWKCVEDMRYSTRGPPVQQNKTCGLLIHVSAFFYDIPVGMTTTNSSRTRSLVHQKWLVPSLGYWRLLHARIATMFCVSIDQSHPDFMTLKPRGRTSMTDYVPNPKAWAALYDGDIARFSRGVRLR